MNSQTAAPENPLSVGATPSESRVKPEARAADQKFQYDERIAGAIIPAMVIFASMAEPAVLGMLVVSCGLLVAYTHTSNHDQCMCSSQKSILSKSGFRGPILLLHHLVWASTILYCTAGALCIHIWRAAGTRCCQYVYTGISRTSGTRSFQVPHTEHCCRLACWLPTCSTPADKRNWPSLQYG